jgi:hypothetical protein
MLLENNKLSKKIFNPDHLSQVEETYLQHFKFAIWAGVVLLLLGLISILHAVFPFLFSRYPDRIYKYFQETSKSRMMKVNSILKQKNLE